MLADLEIDVDVLRGKACAGERGQQGVKLLVHDLRVRTAEGDRREQAALRSREFALVEHMLLLVLARDASIHALEFRNDAPLINEGEAVTVLGLVHVMRGHEDARAAFGQIVDQIPERAARDGIDSGGRFVEK